MAAVTVPITELRISDGSSTPYTESQEAQKRVYIKSHWNALDGKPSTYNPAPHDSTHDSHNDGRYLGKTAKAADSEKLDGQDSTYYRDANNIYHPSSKTGSVHTLGKPLFDVLRADRTAFLPAEQIIIEQSIDGGITWQDAGYSDIDKRKLFSGERPSIRIPLKNGVKSTDCLLRVIITAMRFDQSGASGETDRFNHWTVANVQSTERYCTLDEGWTWVSANSDRIHMKLEYSTGANPTSWSTEREMTLSGWSGGNFFNMIGTNFGGGISQTNNRWHRRFTFRTMSSAGTFNDADLSSSYTTSQQTIYHIKMTGQNIWTTPNKLAYGDSLYSWNYLQDAFFPSEIYADDNKKVYHEGNKPSWTDILSKPSIIDDLVTGGSGNFLSAEQGKVLKGYIDAINSWDKDYNDLINKPTLASLGFTGATNANYITALSQLSEDSTHRLVTDSEKSSWNGKENALDTGDLADINNSNLSGKKWTGATLNDAISDSLNNVIRKVSFSNGVLVIEVL